MKMRPGDTVRIPDLHTVGGADVAVPDATHLTHLQFRRFAGCPICNLHLQSVITRHDEVESAGIQEVVFFHSTTEELRDYAGSMPFDVVADPDQQFYRQFGVERSVRSIMDPRAIIPVMRVMMRGRDTDRRRLPQPRYPAHPTGGRIGLPADLLIDEHGQVLAVKYGRHAYDQWSVDELLALAALRR
jgi:peroxiredoxin